MRFALGDMMNDMIAVNGQQSVTRAGTDKQLIHLWLLQKDSDRTRQTYRIAIEQFLSFAGVDLRSLTMEDVAEYKAHLDGRYNSVHTRKLKLNAVKSLLTFAHETGYTAFNVGRAVKAAKAQTELSHRILTEEQVIQLVNAPERERDRILLRLLYASGGRVSEIAGLTWADVSPNGDSGQIRVTGKGEQERYILLSPATWRALLAYKPEGVQPDEPVFVSQKGGRLDRTAIFRIVKNAGKRAGIDGVSPHWFRHAHASHSLERGASIALVKETLGHANIATTNKYLHAKPNDSSSLHLAL